MPQRKVALKKTERKEELKQLLDNNKKRSASESAKTDEKKKNKKTSTTSAGGSKKTKTEKSWNDTRPIVKIENVPMARSTITETEFPEVDGVLRKHITLGKMRGKDLLEKEHITIPIYYTPNLENPHLVKKVRFGFKAQHPSSDATQYVNNDGGKKPKGKGLKTQPYSVNVAILPNDKRDEFIIQATREVYEACIQEMLKDSFWENIGRLELKPDDESLRNTFKVPFYDPPEGTVMRIKFMFNNFTSQKKFELFDMRHKDDDKKKKKGGKDSTPRCAPQTIKAGNNLSGTFEIEEMYFRPADASWGFVYSWAAVRVFKGEALEVGGSFIPFFLMSVCCCFCYPFDDECIYFSLLLLLRLYVVPIRMRG